MTIGAATAARTPNCVKLPCYAQAPCACSAPVAVYINARLKLTGSQQIVVFTDNHYLADVLGNGRLAIWSRQNWKNSHDQLRPNHDLWRVPGCLNEARRVQGARFISRSQELPLLDEARGLAFENLHHIIRSRGTHHE